jgi:hypothetical protein
MRRQLLLYTTLFAGCHLFPDVVVPFVDTTQPSPTTGVWTQGAYLTWDTPLSVTDIILRESEGDDPGQTWVPFSTTQDSGGAKRVTMPYTTKILCWIWTSPGGGGQTTPIYDEGVLEYIQPGGIQRTVSSGISTTALFNPDAMTSACPAGSIPYWVIFRWSTESADYHGNVDVHPGARLAFEYDIYAHEP